MNDMKRERLEADLAEKRERRRLYIDSFYDKVLISGIQQNVARVIEAFDEMIIRGLLAQGLVWITSRIGMMLSWIQNGALNRYAFVTGFGIIIVIFLMVFMINI